MSPTPAETVDDLVRAGRAALDGHVWQEAFDAFARADHDGHLSGVDLEALALAAFFTGQADLEVEVRQRAFAAYEAAGDTLRAAYVALHVARLYFYAGKQSIASAWARRGEHLVSPGGDTYVHGYLALIHSAGARSAGDLDAALALAEQAIQIGNHAADADLKAYALSNLGSLKIATGATADGFALMEEASIAAVNGELSPFTTGVTACQMIGACRDVTDYKRATEWIEATEKYCSRQSLSGFPGVCRIHRAEVAAVGGAWDRAEHELERATTELTAYNAIIPQAEGFYAIGDIRRLRGDFDGAEAALREAHARGRSPQPALALIRLAEGKVAAAANAINAAVTEQTWDRYARGRLLPAQVEIAIAAGDLERARTAVDALAEIVAGYASPALEASHQGAVARVLLAEGDTAAAITALRSSVRGWRDVGAPYEVARAQVMLARALRTGQDDEGADLELAAALDEFRRLGARIDLEAAERERREVEDRRSGALTTRKTFMFTDIVGSTNLAEALGDQAWERLLRWHDDTLRRLVTAAGGDIVNSTGDGFFAAFGSARPGVDCAISIQQALRDHRVSTGFAPSVRIGLHTAEASRRGTDYSGKGVHVAARVAALAGAGEILATIETLAESGELATSDSRTTPVKGVTAPVSLVTIVWD